MPLLWVLGSKWLPCLLKIGSVIYFFRVNLDNPHSLEMKSSFASTNSITSWLGEISSFVNIIKSCSILDLISSASWFLSSRISHCCKLAVENLLYIVFNINQLPQYNLLSWKNADILSKTQVSRNNTLLSSWNVTTK